jgi:hypothetical protein
MKKISLILGALFILSAFTFSHTDNYRANTKMSKLIWHAQKIKAKHFGNINIKNGELQINHGKIVGAYFIFDMKTITNRDIEDKNYRDMLLKDLNSEKFFNVSKFPEANFKLIKSTPIGENKFDILGQLELKGTVGTVNFPMELIYEGNGKVIAKGTCTFDRTKFGIIYNSGSFFDGLGDKLINDNVKLDFSIVFEK